MKKLLIIIVCAILFASCSNKEYTIEQKASYQTNHIITGDSTYEFSSYLIRWSSVDYMDTIPVSPLREWRKVRKDTLMLSLETNVIYSSDGYNHLILQHIDWINDSTYKEVKCRRYFEAKELILTKIAEKEAKEAMMRRVNNHKCE